MNWLTLARVPEPEVMDDAGEAQAYSSASAEAYLSKIDDTFVEHAISLIGPAPGYAVDIGCGPGQILKKLSARLPEWKFWGVDRSLAMIRLAAERGARHERSHPGESGGRANGSVQFVLGDANALPFRDASFDLVLCNSVLHHMTEPSRLLAEIGRIAKPNAAILLRDLRRPSRIGYSFHVRWHGRHYEGLMYKLYCDSVRAAYMREELAAMLRSADISGAGVFAHGSTHLGIERSASGAPDCTGHVLPQRNSYKRNE
jgi:ubiquinone/menaquinone biosynthesis C-methylase UbiE